MGGHLPPGVPELIEDRTNRKIGPQEVEGSRVGDFNGDGRKDAYVSLREETDDCCIIGPAWELLALSDPEDDGYMLFGADDTGDHDWDSLLDAEYPGDYELFEFSTVFPLEGGLPLVPVQYTTGEDGQPCTFHFGLWRLQKLDLGPYKSLQVPQTLPTGMRCHPSLFHADTILGPHLPDPENPGQTRNAYRFLGVRIHLAGFFPVDYQWQNGAFKRWQAPMSRAPGCFTASVAAGPAVDRALAQKLPAGHAWHDKLADGSEVIVHHEPLFDLAEPQVLTFYRLAPKAPPTEIARFELGRVSLADGNELQLCRNDIGITEIREVRAGKALRLARAATAPGQGGAATPAFTCIDRTDTLTALVVESALAGEVIPEWPLPLLSARQRKIARNAPYARYGHQFKSPELNAYYYGIGGERKAPGQLTVKPDFDESQLNALDRGNVKRAKAKHAKPATPPRCGLWP